MTDFAEIAAAVDAQAGETPADARKELGKYAVRDQVAVLAAGGGGSQPLLPGFVYDAELDYVRVNDDTDTTFVQFQRDAKRLVADSLKVDGAAVFNGETTAYNDNGDPLLEADPLANAGDGEVRINGAAFSSAGYQQTSEKAQPDGYASLDSGGLVPTAQLPPVVVLDNGETRSFVSSSNPDVKVIVSRDTDVLVLELTNGATTSLRFTSDGEAQSNQSGDIYRFALLPPVLPELPASPTEQNIADALVALGFVTQAA